jgi:4'-phosphopantetheinyl transferase
MKFYQYNIRVLSDESYTHYYSLMSEEKKQRVDRFRFDDDKKRTIVGELLARRAISKWCGVSEESIVFETTANGKPYAKNLNVEFNISHSADMVVCVVDDKPVGVDIEKIRPVDLNTAKRIFREEEIQYIFGCTSNTDNYNHYLNDVVLQRFFELWTKKEAYGKLVGMGLFTEINATATVKTWTENGYCISIAISVNK